MKAIRKPITVEVTKWLKDGDHASIKPYERYDCAGHVICQLCGYKMKTTVCCRSETNAIQSVPAIGLSKKTANSMSVKRQSSTKFMMKYIKIDLNFRQTML